MYNFVIKETAQFRDPNVASTHPVDPDIKTTIHVADFVEITENSAWIGVRGRQGDGSITFDSQISLTDNLGTGPRPHEVTMIVIENVAGKTTQIYRRPIQLI